MIDKATFVLVADILRTSLGDIQPALDAIAKLAAEELVPGGRDGQVMFRRQDTEILQVFCIAKMNFGLVFFYVRHQCTALIALAHLMCSCLLTNGFHSLLLVHLDGGLSEHFRSCRAMCFVIFNLQNSFKHLEGIVLTGMIHSLSFHVITAVKHLEKFYRSFDLFTLRGTGSLTFQVYISPRKE